jgi:hypothetical protein
MTELHSRTVSAQAPPVPQGVAATLLLRFLKQPFAPATSLRVEDLSDAEHQWLARVVSSLGLPDVPGPWPESDVIRIRNVLAHALEKDSLDSARFDAARARLGEAGLLRPSEYRLQIGEIVREFERLGDRRTYIERSVLEADVVQHLSHRGGDDQRKESPEGLSLFARLIDTGKRPPFAHLVVTGRKGASLEFQAAWRIVRQVVDWNPSMTPLDLLKGFVDRFGVLLEVPGRLPTKFVLFDAIPKPTQGFRGVLRPAESMNPNHDFSVQMMLRMNQQVGLIEISMAYQIDTTIYRQSLQEHSLL